jgi:class 3 adenylate cyclase
MVCFLLTISSYIINRDATRLVLDPIERMIERVRIVAKNPMALCSEDEIENEGMLAMINSKSKNKNKKETEDDHKNETKFLERSLYTIGRLLGLCFGEAGAKIIGNNIASSEVGSDFNPIMPGVKGMAIFGFCDIRGFGDATEALEQEVMMFVNQIAEIVHSECDLHQGASNKNLGEAFLMVWKFPTTDIDSFDEELSIRPDNRYCNNIADLALISFLKINVKINKYTHILEYGKNEKMLERIPNYKVNMGFGLHVGWGIEGAIGSPYKIDASYLSPNVNISARLEAGTRQYGVSILISGELQEILNEPFKHITRLIDIAAVKGSEFPMKFYTVNLKVDVIEEEKAPFDGMTVSEKKKMRSEARKDLITKLNNEIIYTEDLLKEDEELQLMMTSHKSNEPEFKRVYTKGFEQYVAGDWVNANQTFKNCIDLNPEDGPVRTLIHYIESLN